MSDRFSSNYPEDEPIIGGPYAPSAPRPAEEEYIGDSSGQYYANGEGYADEPDGDEYYDEYDDEEEYYDDYADEYDAVAPGRQPLFYIFIALAALVGGIVVFLLFSLVNSGDGKTAGTGSTKFAVSIDSPTKDSHLEIGKPQDVNVQASATEPIVRFELFVGDKLTDSVQVTDTPPDNKYRALLHFTLTTRGNYDIFVRVTAESGATKDSSKTRIVGIESVGERPQSIKGKVQVDTTLRAGPGDNYPEAGTLKGGDEVTILGKNKTIDWLLVDSPQGSRWAKRSAIEPQDSLDLVPIRDVTPTPAPTAPPTNTALPSPSPSASTSPTVNPNSPDFVPSSAVLIDGGGTLRVTVQNLSSSAYNGPLVVGVGGDIPANEIVIDAKLAASGGTATVDFELAQPIKETGKKAVVTVDPKNAIKEQREDNNGATFVLLPPEEAPDIAIQAPAVTPSTITVVIKNSGGPLTATNVTVRVKLGAQETSASQNLALANGQTASFAVARPPGDGQATAEVVIGGQVVASAQFTINP